MTATLEQAARDVRTLDAAHLEEEPIPHYLAVRYGGAGELVVEGNQAGLVHLAAELLELAAGKTPGSHYHLDEAGLAESAKPVAVFTFRRGSWDR